jgi:hypothetical protein
MTRRARFTVAIAVLACMAFPLVLSAATVEVHNVAELTNAVARANAGEKVNGESIDAIRLMKSGSPYVFNDEYMSVVTTGAYCGTNFLYVTANLTFEGEEASSRSGWTDHDEPVIVNGGGKGRIISVASGSTLTVKNMAFTGGNCRYENVNSYGGVACNANSGGNPPAKYKVTFTNCVFRQNSAKTAGGVVYNCVLRDCLITNNLACSAVCESDSYKCDYVDNTVRCLQNANKHYDCTFTANGSEATESGVICYCYGGILLSNCTIRANTPKGRMALCGLGGTYIDCLFEDNDAAPGINHSEYNPTMLNCKFRRNRSVCAGAPKLIDGCVFEDNTGTPVSVQNLKGGFESRIVNSTFRHNLAGTYANGGAIWCSHRYDSATYFGTCFISNCVFECNYATNGGGNIGGAIYNGGEKATEQWKFPTSTMPCDYTKVYDCTFKSNVSAACGGVYGVTAVRCKFEGNRKALAGSAWVASDAWKCKLTDCDLDGGGITDAFLDRCRIHDVKAGTSGGYGILQDYIRATNILVESCNSFAIYGVLASTSNDPSYTNKVMDAEFVNCTFVTNHANTLNIPNRALNATNGVAFKNCIFYDNGYERPSDLELYYGGPGSQTCHWDKVSFTRCCYKLVNVWNIPQYKTNPPPAEDFFQCVDPKFAGRNPKLMARYPREPFWALSYASPLLGKGATLGWTEGAIDLAGRLRVREGNVDIGAYECWLNPPGMMMKIK